MGECVMSLYGIGRLLESRELGPNHLLPAIEDLGSTAAEHCGQVREAVGQLRREAAAHPLLLDALALLQPVIDVLSSELAGTFDRPLKLNAVQRLELERSSTSLGGQVESLRELLALIDAASQHRPARLSLVDLIQGGTRSPTFAASPVTVQVGRDSCPQVLNVDPRVWSALFDYVLRELSTEAVDCVLMAKRADRPELTLRAVPRQDVPANPQLETRWLLGRPSSVEKGVVGRVADHLAIHLERRGDSAIVGIEFAEE